MRVWVNRELHRMESDAYVKAAKPAARVGLVSLRGLQTEGPFFICKML